MPEREEIVTLARLPHLSRFHLMSSEACRQPVQEFLSYVYAPDRQVPMATGPSLITHPEDGRQHPQKHLERDTPRDLDASVPHRIYSGSHSPDRTSRLSGIDGADLHPEWEAHIQVSQARAAFCLLVDLAASSSRLVLSFRRKGVLKTCRLHDRAAGRAKLPYSFIVNRSWVKFYFRLPEVRSGRDRLKRDFESFDDGNSRGEWTVKLRTENDVRRLLTHVDRLGYHHGGPAVQPRKSGILARVEKERMKLFDGYVAVDWSANGKPKQGKDSIWIAFRGVGGTEEPANPATRRKAVRRIERLLEEATAAGRRLLVGFDFPFGYPAGTARMLTGRDGWEAVWLRIAEVIEDGPRNATNRFDAAALLNSAFEGEGPFWGNGLQRDIPGLPRTKPPSGWGVNLPANLRHAESEVKRAQEVWKLNGAGSVGGQALTGIAALEGLRHSASAQVWPFETVGEGRSHVLAEIYPSLIEPSPGPEVKDARQVDAVAAALQKLDESGALKRHLRAPSQMPAAVREEEGLILGMQDPTGFQRAARAGS